MGENDAPHHSHKSGYPCAWCSEYRADKRRDRAARIDELKSMLAEEFSMYLMDNEIPPGSYLRTSIEHRIAELEADGG